MNSLSDWVTTSFLNFLWYIWIKAKLSLCVYFKCWTRMTNVLCDKLFLMNFIVWISNLLDDIWNGSFPIDSKPHWSGRPSSSWGCWLVPNIALFSGQFLSSWPHFICFDYWILVIFILDWIFGWESKCRLNPLNWCHSKLPRMLDDLCLLRTVDSEGLMKIQSADGQIYTCVSIQGTCVSIHMVILEEYQVWIDSATAWKKSMFQSIHSFCVSIHREDSRSFNRYLSI